MSTMITCPSCGAEAAADEKFCEICGAPLDGPVAEPTPAGTPTVPPAAAGPAHDGTLLDDRTAAATDVARRPSPMLVTDTDLATVPPVCATCAGTVASDGYCEQCGAAAPRRRDHWCDQPATWLAAVCDRGVRHSRNEDAMAVSAALVPGSLGALVVCDGVSMAVDSDVASLAAARAARDVLIAGLTLRRPASAASTRTGQQTARAGDFAARIVAAGAAAQAKAAEASVGVAEGKNPPSCTFVAALVERSTDSGPSLVVTGWVGDSRAYWVPDDGAAVQLSEDDSWAAEAIAQGVPRAEAENMPQSHAITRWLGVDAPDPVPRTRVHPLDRAGWLLVCSDGLWNYRSEASDLGALVATLLAERAPDGAPADDPVALAEELTAWAIAQGGHDNITVALARMDPDAPTDPIPLPVAVEAAPGPAAAPAAEAAPEPVPLTEPAAVPVPETVPLVEPPSAPSPLPPTAVGPTVQNPDQTSAPETETAR